MSDLSYEVSSFSTQRSCECYKKLQAYGIPLYLSDENDYYVESPKKIYFENAFELPGILKINENITEYLYVEDNELCNVFVHMAEVIPNLSDFEQNLLSFWILDMFIEGLWTAQNKQMSFEHQKATLYWIAYMFNYIQEKNPTRKNLFDHLKTVIFHINWKKVEPENPEEKQAETMKTHRKHTDINWKDGSWKLPLPPRTEESKQKAVNDDIKIATSEASEEDDEEKSANESTGGDKNSEVTVEIESNNSSLTNLNNMTVILEILYRIFGRFWVYLEIQTVFHAMPPTKQVDLPFTLNCPKPLLKPDVSLLLRSDKIGRKASTSDKSLEEMEGERQLHKNDYILPLQAADESKLILKQYFPQPNSQRSIFSRRKT